MTFERQTCLLKFQRFESSQSCFKIEEDEALVGMLAFSTKHVNCCRNPNGNLALSLKLIIREGNFHDAQACVINIFSSLFLSACIFRKFMRSKLVTKLKLNLQKFNKRSQSLSSIVAAQFHNKQKFVLSRFRAAMKQADERWMNLRRNGYKNEDVLESEYFQAFQKRGKLWGLTY